MFYTSYIAMYHLHMFYIRLKQVCLIVFTRCFRSLHVLLIEYMRKKGNLNKW